MSPLIYCLDGNIGAGKTTVLDELEKRGYCVFREDIKSWEISLEKYYSDQTRWAFTLQIAVLHSLRTQKRKITDITNHSVVFIERSPLSGMVFSKVLYNRGNMTFDELKLIESVYKNIGWVPDLTMILSTPFDLCFNRMQQRQRFCEQTVDILYLEELANEYSKIRDNSVMILDHRGLICDVADRIVEHLPKF